MAETEPRDLTKPLAAFLSYLAGVLLEVDKEDHRNRTSSWLVDHLTYDAASGFYEDALGRGQLSEQDIESLKSIHALLTRACSYKKPYRPFQLAVVISSSPPPFIRLAKLYIIPGTYLSKTGARWHTSAKKPSTHISHSCSTAMRALRQLPKGGPQPKRLTSRSVHGTTVAPIPILVEAKIGNTPFKRREAVRQARSRLAAAPRSLAFGLCYPAHLRDGSVSAQATQNALAESIIAFAPAQRFGRESTWREGSVADLADSLRNADLSRQLVADTIEYTVRKAADMLLNYGHAPDLASALALPKRKEDLRAASLVAALMLSNAALLHHRLRLVPALAGVVKLKTALSEPTKTPTIIREAWQAILSIDFHPVFAPALAALKALNDDDAREPMRWIAENAVAVADELASLRFDHAGSLYHRLLASARYDGSFYTNNVSAMLLARLALTENTVNWSDANALAELKIIDPACGTGTLLMAAMHAIRDRHENAAGAEADSAPLHLALVEDVLYGLDINRHGVQLAACNLTLGNPRVDYSRMNLFTMQHGPQPNGRAKAGSLEFLATAKDESDLARFIVPLPTTGELDAERAEPGAAPSKALTGLFDPRHHEPTVYSERHSQRTVQQKRSAFRTETGNRNRRGPRWPRPCGVPCHQGRLASNHFSHHWRTHS